MGGTRFVGQRLPSQESVVGNAKQLEQARFLNPIIELIAFPQQSITSSITKAAISPDGCCIGSGLQMFFMQYMCLFSWQNFCSRAENALAADCNLCTV